MIKRQLLQEMAKRSTDKKAIIILGPRQSGKTTLTQDLVTHLGRPALFLNADDTDVRWQLEKPTVVRLKKIIGQHKVVVIDEAQRIANIGICIKLITDNISGVKVIASGSSAFELANKINEPLTGRKWECYLYPISYGEMVSHHGSGEEKKLLNHRLVYGYYPDVVMNPGSEQEILKQLSDSYLYKDILTWQRINKPDRLERLTQALAYQMGNEVSYKELGDITGLNNETVEHYISLLEKAFVIFRLYTYTRNPRNELKKKRKVYFYDNGLRNALINQFNPIGLRQDVGALWENFLVSERIKHTHYSKLYCNRFFWRNMQQQEIDYIEEREASLFAYEFKWSSKAKPKFSKTFTRTYPDATTMLITPDNFEEFVF